MPVSLSLRKQTTFYDVLTGSPPPPRKWQPRNKHTNLPFTDHALLPNYQYEIGLFKIYLKTFGCPSKILHISIVSLLGLTPQQKLKTKSIMVFLERPISGLVL